MPGYSISQSWLRNPSPQVKEKRDFLHAADSPGLRQRVSRPAFLGRRAGADWCAGRQVLPGGLGRALRAARHLHLWAEHSGRCPGAALSGPHR